LHSVADDAEEIDDGDAVGEVGAAFDLEFLKDFGGGQMADGARDQIEIKEKADDQDQDHEKAEDAENDFLHVG
jgi:hypothetical protein